MPSRDLVLVNADQQKSPLVRTEIVVVPSNRPLCHQLLFAVTNRPLA